MRSDAPEGAKGKPCGASHIPKKYKCSKPIKALTPQNLQTAAKVALAVSAVAGGAYLIKRRMMSTEEWRKSPESARNKPKLAPEDAKRIADQAIAGGDVWDVQEGINARRRVERAAECGGGLGKLLAPAKFDAAIPHPRCQAGEGAFGTYFVHPSKKYGVKLFKDGSNDNVDYEFDMLDRADRAKVNAPKPLSMNATKDEYGDVRAQTLVLTHMDGYRELSKVYRNSYGTAADAPLITQVKLAREFRKLHTEGLAHGDIHGGNILVNPRTKQPALVDFGYATHLADIHPGHGRTGIQNMMSDLRRLPQFFGLPGRGDEFLERYKGVLENIEKQATTWDSGSYQERRGAWDRFELGIKRYHDALEAELLWDDRLTRSRFISGADQPRIPGLTRRILTANANTRERDIMARDMQRFPTDFRQQAEGLGVKPAKLMLALQPERDARKQQKPFGTPMPVPTRLNTAARGFKRLPDGRLEFIGKPVPPMGTNFPSKPPMGTNFPSKPPKPAIKVKRNPNLPPRKTPTGMVRFKPGTPTGMRRVRPGVDEFTGT